MELIKENIEYEQLLGENSADTVIKNEFLIPDTHPDVEQVLMVDVKTSIINKEVLQDKVYLEGQIQYNVLYLAKEDDEKVGIYNITYTDKFSNHIDLKGAEFKMNSEADCYMEHMDCTIINERKVSLGGIIKLKCAVYKGYNFEIVKDVNNAPKVQMLKSPIMVDKIAGMVNGDLIVKSNIQVSGDKPSIGTILKCDMNVHKKEIVVLDGKVQVSAFSLVQILYRGKDSNEVILLKDDVYISKEMELDNVNSSMDSFGELTIGAMEFNIKEDDMGENRIIDIEAIITADVKVMYKDEIDLIDDIYSTDDMMEMVKRDYLLNVKQGQESLEVIVKENIEVDEDKPTSVVMTIGKVIITDKKVMENKVSVEGIVKVEVLYRTSDERNYLSKVNDEIPFTTTLDIPGTKIDMQCVGKAYIESLEASVEANTIAVKAIVFVQARVNYITSKEFLVDIVREEMTAPVKKASIIIYVVQTGDSLWKIAKKYYTTIEDLAKINSIENPDLIKVGQKILVPGRAIV